MVNGMHAVGRSFDGEFLIVCTCLGRFVFYQTIKNAVRGPTIEEGDSSVVAAAVENFL